MKNILVLGAGRSSSVLINYLLQKARENSWQIIVADTSIELAKEKIANHGSGKAMAIDITEDELLFETVKSADVVISLLPPAFHLHIAKACLKFSKHLLTASYVTPEIAALHEEAVKKNILILMETGLDPGIDHMSAKKEIDGIKAKGGEIISFKSYTGGLVAPEYDNNPWHYKFTWNPKNVVLAGQGAVKYLEGEKYKFIPYQRLFERLEKITVPGYGEFEGYANRDSLKYISDYQLDTIPDFIRGTLRRPGYCRAWNVFVQLGITDDTYTFPNTLQLTHRQFLNAFLKEDANLSLEERLCKELNILYDGEEFKKIKWLNFFEEIKIELTDASPAQILQSILEKKWKLEPGDKDMIVMQHQLEYRVKNQFKKLTSSLVVIGDNEVHTAMAKTVGLPLGIVAVLLLKGKLDFMKGVNIPIGAQIYDPVLKELMSLGVNFINSKQEI